MGKSEVDKRNCTLDFLRKINEIKFWQINEENETQEKDSINCKGRVHVIKMCDHNNEWIRYFKEGRSKKKVCIKRMNTKERLERIPTQDID